MFRSYTLLIPTDLADVKATGEHICRDEDLGHPVSELLDHAVTVRVLHVSLRRPRILSALISLPAFVSHAVNILAGIIRVTKVTLTDFTSVTKQKCL